MKPERLAFLEYGMGMALMASSRATCRRRLVGCAIFNSHRVVVATGYNGAPSGAPQCDQVGCMMIDGHCNRITHAEKNAVIFSGERDLTGGYAFVTTRPCKDCFDFMVSRGIKFIYYLDNYRAEETSEYFKQICLKENIHLEQVSFCPVQLMQKVIDFHQGSGGLLIDRFKLRIVEDVPEIMDH